MPSTRTGRVAQWGTAAAALFVGGIAAELTWIARRPLPTLTGLDASGALVRAGTPTRSVRLVALGDSTLTGPGLDDADDVWLRQALRRIGDLDGVDVTSLAVGGSRVVDVLDVVDRALALEPDIIVLAVGANDAIHGTPLRRFSARFDELLTRLAAGTSVVAVANVGDLGNIARIPWPVNAVLRARSESFCAAIESSVATHDRVVLLDVTPSNEVFRDRGVFAADLFHPNREGHAAWADAAVPGLVQVFELVQTRSG